MEDESRDDAVLRLARHHGDMVFTLARRYCDSPAEVDDVVQDVWTRVIQLLGANATEAPSAGWLAAVTMNVGKEFMRKRARSRKAPVLAGRVLGSDVYQPEPDPPMGDVMTKRIWAAIEGLPDLQREVLMRRIFDGMSVADTARAIRRAPGTVKASLHRAIKAVRKDLDGLEELWKRDEL